MKHAVIIWEKTVYFRTKDGWQKNAIGKTENAVNVLADNFKKGSKFCIAYDPYILSTEVVDCPKGPRTVMRESFLETHDMISNEETAWGYQPQWSSGGGGFSTYLSYETNPSLLPMMQKAEEEKVKISSVYPLATLVSQTIGAPGKTSVFLMIDSEIKQAYMAISSFTGMRAIRKIFNSEDRPVDLWAEIQLFLAEYGVAFDFVGHSKPQIKIFQASNTDVKTECPFWSEMNNACSVDIQAFDALEKLLFAVPSRHIGSMTAGFPQVLNIDPVFQGLAVVTLLALGFVGWLYWSEQQEFLEQQQEITNQKNAQAIVKNQLLKNKKEIESLKVLFSEDNLLASKEKIRFIQGFSEGLPLDYTVTNLRIFQDNAFQMDGILWNLNAKTTKENVANPIIMALERSVKGVLVDSKKTQFKGQERGELTIEGSIPKQFVK